ncbi:MAG: YciI family protein [Bacteroidetes bacterium]|nr:YciI family protein [Bacteroidota bacterium]
MFIITVTYARPLAEIDQHMSGHIAFLDKYYKAGKIIFSGKQQPRTGGVILAHQTTETEINQMLAEDPFQQLSLATYSVMEVVPTKWDKRFDHFIERPQ